MNTKEKSGERIKAAREKRKISLQKVSDLVDGVVSRSRLSNYEQGTRMIDVDTAKIIAPILGTTPEYILTLTNEFPDPQVVELVELFKICDTRGKDATLDTAKKQAALSTQEIPTEKTVVANQDHPIESPPERRSGEERRKVDLGFDPERRHFYGAPNFPQKVKTYADRRRKAK